MLRHGHPHDAKPKPFLPVGWVADGLRLHKALFGPRVVFIQITHTRPQNLARPIII